MAQPTMAVRIAANLSELKKNLAEGKDQIEAVKAGFTKLATSFQGDKIIQAAHNAAAAVESIGGASKLTEAEQARVNATVERALAKYAALGKEAPSALRELADQTKRTSDESTSWAGKLDSYVTGAVAGLAATVTNWGLQMAQAAIRGFGEFVRLGGQVASMQASFTALSGGVQQADERIDAIRATTMGLVSNMDIMQASNKSMLLGLGLNAAQMGELAKTATVLGRAMGQDATKSLDDLITALGRSSPMILDNLGLSVKVGEANERYAAQLGKTVEALSDAEKKQAFMNAAMDAAAEKVNTLGGVHLTAADRITQMWTSIKNVTDATASWVVQLGAVNSALDSAQESMSTWEALLRGGPMEALENYKRATGDIIPEVVKLAEAATFAKPNIAALALSQADAGLEIVTYTTRISAARGELADMSAETKRQIDAAILMQVGTAKIAETMGLSEAAVNLYKEALKQTSARMKEIAEETKKSEDALKKFWEQADKLGKDSIPNLTLAMGKWDKEAKDHVTLVDLTASGYAKANAEAQKWANTHGAVFAPTVKQSMDTATESTNGFLGHLKSLFGGGGGGSSSGGEGGSKMSQFLNNVGPQFAAAFMGPGSAGDKLKNFATAAAGTLMGMIPGVGPWLQAFSGPIVEGLSKLASKAKDILSGIFGGPSGTEKEQRSLVDEFEKDLANGLTATQKLEAGGESWKQTVIAVRDAYMAQGRTAAEAEADVKMLWESSKKGAGATAAALAEIKRKMAEAAIAGKDMADTVTEALDGIPRDIDININGKYNQDGEPPGFATGSNGIKDFGRGTMAILHGKERVQTEAQMNAEKNGGGGDMGEQLARVMDFLEYKLPLAMRDAMAGA